jgi:hypothetical protein
MLPWSIQYLMHQVICQAAGVVDVPKPEPLGSDIAGVIDEVGTGVTGHAVGDEVIGSAFGGYAQHAVVAAAGLVAKPSAVPWEALGDQLDGKARKDRLRSHADTMSNTTGAWLH